MNCETVIAKISKMDDVCNLHTQKIYNFDTGLNGTQSLTNFKLLYDSKT